MNRGSVENVDARPEREPREDAEPEAPERFIGRKRFLIGAGGVLAGAAGAAIAAPTASAQDPLDGAVLRAPASSDRNLVEPTDAAVLPLSIRGASGQTADLQQWRSASDAVLARVTASGAFNLSSLAVQGLAGQDMQTWQGASGSAARFSAGGQLVIKADNPDPYGQLTLDNLTAAGPPYKRAQISFLVDGVWKWAMGVDVGGPPDDFYLLYRRDPVVPANSTDVIYVTNERYPRLGFQNNNPQGTVHVENYEPARTALVASVPTGSTGWIARFMRNGSPLTGVYNDGSVTVGNSTVPTEKLDVFGNVRADGFKPRNSLSSFATGVSGGFLYGSAEGGAAYPFTEAGHVVVQGRSDPKGPIRDVILATGSPAAAQLVVKGNGNLGIRTSSGFGNGVGVVGIANALVPPTANPAGGGVLWVDAGDLKYRGPTGRVTVLARA